LNMTTGRLMWRFFAGAPIRTKVEATDRDVYVTPHQEGLACLNRETGRQRWMNKTAQRFLSTNYKFVYAADRRGQLMVLDYERATTLARYDASESAVPVTNDLNDRLFLANHDGQLICLHHRKNRQPLSTKSLIAQKDEKKPPEDKDKEKDKDKEME